MELDTRSTRMINYDHRDRASTRLVSHDHFLTARTLHLRLKYESDFLSLSLSIATLESTVITAEWTWVPAEIRECVEPRLMTHVQRVHLSRARAREYCISLMKYGQSEPGNVIVWNIKSFIASEIIFQSWVFRTSISLWSVKNACPLDVYFSQFCPTNLSC